METTMFSKSLDEDDRPENNEDNIDQIFYRPLCFSGYLTPLQRKKLREKRKLMDDDSEVSNPSKVIKLRTVKRTADRRLGVPLKITKRLKTKEKFYTPPMKYSASKIIKTTGMDGADRKFFKSSSSDRLEKAVFSMPFACKKNVSSIIERTVKQNLSQSKKCDLKERFDTTPELSDVRNDSEIENAVVTSPTMEPQETCNNPQEKIFEFEWPSDHLLLKRQEQARADLRKKLTARASVTESKENKLSNDDKVMKLYPVFCSALQKSPKVCQDSKRRQNRSKSCWSGEEQMVIDAGQKEMLTTTCNVCHMFYTIGLDVDEATHRTHHNRHLKNLLKFPGWKAENVIGKFVDGRIILVRREDPSFKLKKIADVFTVANRDLGFPSSVLPSKPDLIFILFVASGAKQVAGLLIAEPISSANRALLAKSKSLCQERDVWRKGDWYSSSESVPAVCGISRIWVSHEYRRHRIASRMIDCLRSHFVYGHVISLEELAFTDPSLDGCEFAAAYTGTDNFLVYR